MQWRKSQSDLMRRPTREAPAASYSKWLPTELMCLGCEISHADMGAPQWMNYHHKPPIHFGCAGVTHRQHRHVSPSKVFILCHRPACFHIISGANHFAACGHSTVCKTTSPIRSQMRARFWTAGENHREPKLISTLWFIISLTLSLQLFWTAFIIILIV